MNRISIKEIFDDNGFISNFKEGYKSRTAQIEAASIIEQTLQENGIAIVEGETGMGKSFAYLFPTLKEIVESGCTKKAIIVTSGISLQEQLNLKDLPFVKKVMLSMYPELDSSDLEFTLLKGKQNFICPLKVKALGLYETSKQMIDSSYERIYDFVNNTRTGDLSELDFIPEQSILENISCTKKGECTGRRCSEYSNCHYAAHRNKLMHSNIVITNYHMLFSDDNTGGNILPPHDILVFDEAHEAVNIFRDFNSCKLSYNSMFYLRNKCSEINNLSEYYGSILDTELFQNAVKEFEIEFERIDMKFPELNSPVILRSRDELPSTYFDLVKPLTLISDNVATVINKTEEIIEAHSDSSDKDEELEKIAKINMIALTMEESIGEMMDLIRGLDNLLECENDVVWVEKINDVISINFKEVEVGGKMNTSFFSAESKSVILTSATMSVGKTFDYIKEQLGLVNNNKKIHEFIGSSPFNLTDQQLWYLPPNTIEANKFGFDKLLPGMIEDIIKATGGGVLCLFTSVRNMRNTYLELRYKIKQDIYVQGDMPRSKLVQKFKDNSNSVLFGTRSFFTGVDVPGNSLRCVVIDKFPFPQPTDPVQQKLQERQNSFYKYSIPEMVITLKQAVGRGVRSVDDKCVIAILDGRMATAKYKAKINNSFGYKKTGTRNIDDVRDFCKDLIGNDDVAPSNEFDEETGFYNDEIPF